MTALTRSSAAMRALPSATSPRQINGRPLRDAERFPCRAMSTRACQGDAGEEMRAASEAMEFERAAALRDWIRPSRKVQSAQGIKPQATAGGRCPSRCTWRSGQACVHGCLHPRQTRTGAIADLLPRPRGAGPGGGSGRPSIVQFYDSKDPPRSHPPVDPRERTRASLSRPFRAGGR